MQVLQSRKHGTLTPQCEILARHSHTGRRTRRDPRHSRASCGLGTALPDNRGSGSTASPSCHPPAQQQGKSAAYHIQKGKTEWLPCSPVLLTGHKCAGQLGTCLKHGHIPAGVVAVDLIARGMLQLALAQVAHHLIPGLEERQIILCKV